MRKELRKALPRSPAKQMVSIPRNSRLNCCLDPCVMWVFVACYVEVIMFEMEASHDSPYIMPVLSGHLFSGSH